MKATSVLVTSLGVTIATGCARAPKASPGPKPEMTMEATEAETPQAPSPLVQAQAQAQAPPQASGWATTPLPGGAGPVVVKQGPVPLVYLVESGGVFRVHDETDHKDLARAEALGRTIIRVDARAGIAIGRETLVSGPLPADHRYVIYFDPSGPNYSRQGTFQPRPK
jgi:hypothetical protein